MTLIKFCGMTREEDVAAAIALGVDAVGFVLWPGSPRHVDVDRARALIEKLPAAVTPVGVFVAPTRDDVARTVDRAGIRIAQIYDGGTGAFHDVGCEMWIATSFAGDEIATAIDDTYTVLLDAHDPEQYGGTGRTIDWSRAARIAATRRVILAGGLTPANVAEALREVRPYGVDVASGIEQRPGVKDAQAMRAFVTAVREADQ